MADEERDHGQPAPGEQIPENEQLTADEQLPTKVLPSDYVVVTNAEQIEKDRRAKPSHGPVKPPGLPTDTYVVQPKVEPKPSKATASSKPASIKPDSLPADSYVVVPGNSVPATAPVGDPQHSTKTEVLASGAPQIVYVTAPVPPRPKSNRLFGTAIALAATALFAIVFAIATLVIYRGLTGIATLNMLANIDFWIPVVVFGVAFLVATLVVNRAGWWAQVIASLLVGVVVFFVAPLIIGVLDLYVFRLTTITFADLLRSPLTLFAALIAREVALWAGVAVSSRGRRVKARNLEARAAFDSEQAEATAAR